MVHPSTLHPRTFARRRILFPYRLIVMQGRIYRVDRRWSKTGTPTMRPPAPATLRDILDFAEVQGESPRDLLDRIRGADRQWQLDHA